MLLLLIFGTCWRTLWNPLGSFGNLIGTFWGTPKNLSQKHLIINLGIVFNLNLELKVLIKVEVSNLKLYIKKIRLAIKTNRIYFLKTFLKSKIGGSFVLQKTLNLSSTILF